MAIESWAATDTGRVRSENDNAFYRSSRRGVLLVANGIGGGAKGQAASSLLLERVQEGLAKLEALGASPPLDREAALDQVQELFHEASRRIFERSQKDSRLGGMATTACLAFVCGRSAAVANVGHNVLYLVRDGKTVLLTTPHTVAQGLVDRGVLAADQLPTSPFRNVLSRSIGKHMSVEVDALWLDLRPGDYLVVASNGFCEHVATDEVAGLISPDPSQFCQRAIALCNKRGGRDNVTVVLARVPDSADPSGAQASLDSQARIEALRGLPLFASLEYGELLRMLRIVYERRYDAGAELVREGTTGESVYVIVEGSARVTQQGVELTTLGPGKYFGEVTFVDGGSRSATVTALEPTTVLTFSRRDFLKRLVVEDPKLSTRLLWGFCQNVARRLRELSADFVRERAADGDADSGDGAAGDAEGAEA